MQSRRRYMRYTGRAETRSAQRCHAVISSDVLLNYNENEKRR